MLFPADCITPDKFFICLFNSVSLAVFCKLPHASITVLISTRGVRFGQHNVECTCAHT